MTPATFCEQFATFAEAPNGVAKLRELILQLAVHGKLGTQDVNDEPVEMLMQTIDHERSTPQTVKPTASSRVEDANAPHTLPATWCWLPLTSVFVPISAGDKKLKTTEYQKAGRIPIIDQGQRFIAGYTDDEEKLTRLPGPVVIFGDHTKELKFVDFDFAHGADGIKILRPIGVDARYFYLVLRSYSLDDRGYGRHYKILLSQLVPLPPLAEQRRIVGKVDQLLGLCDELAARQAARREARREARKRLVGATLDRLVSARSAAEFPAHAHRLRDHFDRVFDTPTTLPQLRQAILQLAVQGQLVPQNPNDEPAETLIARIAKKLATQNEAKRGKRNGSASEESAHLQPHDLPSSWCWARFDQIATIASNLVPPKDFADLPHVAPDNIEKGTGRLLPYQTVAEDNVRSGNHRFYAGQILYSKIRPNLSKATIVDFDGLCSADMYPINSHIDPDFLLRFILSRTFLDMAIRNDTRVAMPKINQEELNRILIALPPLSEQKRIVSQVTALLSLCDALEAKLTQAESASTQLLAAAVAHLLQEDSREGAKPRRKTL